MEVNKLTVASLGFGKSLSNASYNILITSLLTSMFDNRVPPLAAIEQQNNNRCKEMELCEMKENSQKKGEHLYHVMSPEALISNTLPLSPV